MRQYVVYFPRNKGRGCISGKKKYWLCLLFRSGTSNHQIFFLIKKTINIFFISNYDKIKKEKALPFSFRENIQLLSKLPILRNICYTHFARSSPLPQILITVSILHRFISLRLFIPQELINRIYGSISSLSLQTSHNLLTNIILSTCHNIYPFIIYIKCLSFFYIYYSKIFFNFQKLVLKCVSIPVF